VCDRLFSNKQFIEQFSWAGRTISLTNAARNTRRSRQRESDLGIARQFSSSVRKSLLWRQRRRSS
jgi:hypothetical protein